MVNWKYKSRGRTQNMNTPAELAQAIVDQIKDASPAVIQAIQKANISDDAKLAMLYFADPEFRAQIIDQTAQAMVAQHQN